MIRMHGGTATRLAGLAILSLGVILAITALGGSAHAIARLKYCWIDSKTGKPVNTYPIGASPSDWDGDLNHWSNPRNGKNYVRLPDGRWIDSKTGKPVNTYPIGASPRDWGGDLDHWSNSRNGKSYVRVPCMTLTARKAIQPAPAAASPFSFGFGIGGGPCIGLLGRCRDDDRRDPRR